MDRRKFIKSMGLFGSSVLVPSMMGGQGLISNAHATGISSRQLINARAVALGEIDYVKPTEMPQVISVFLYGGPSELAGNLTNIEDIDANSQNPYDQNLMPGNGNHTLNNFWANAGGNEMERMIARGRLSIYRTLHRELDDSRAHRPSIFSNLTGLVGEEDSRPGIATNLAAVLSANNAIPENALFPFVTFEGDSVVFNQGDTPVPLNLRPISLNRDLRNPYDRRNNTALNSDINDQNAVLDGLAKTVMAATTDKHRKAVDAFTKRNEIDGFIQQLNENLNNISLPADPDFVPPEDDPTAEAPLLQYDNNGFGPRMRAAVNLAIHNPDSLFISVGNSGLGGWDDHNSALDEYPDRMRNLMRALETAAKHLEVAGKSNVVINVYGDFGRNVNLNNSLGWDHGNNQNFFTVGAGPSAGAGISGRQLGKIVGKTVREGDSKQNRQFTVPTSDSYQCEPFAVASTIYKYFGIQNPEILTDNISPIDETGTNNEWINPNA